MQMSSRVDVGGLGAKKSATYVGQYETKSICLLPQPWGPSTPKGPKGTRCTHFCGLLLRHATKLLWGLVNLRTLRMSTKKKSQIIALNGATPAAAKRENRLSSRNSPTPLPPTSLASFHITLWWLFLSPRHAIFSWCRRLLLKWLTTELRKRKRHRNVWVYECLYVCMCAGPRQTFAISMAVYPCLCKLCKRRRPANDCC